MKNRLIALRELLIINSSLLILSACSTQKQIAKSAKEDVLSTKALQAAHVGISIFDPATNKYLYNYQGDKYFVPASNAKLPTCYAAMKYLGDSLVGLRYGIPDRVGYKKTIVIEPSGDPTFFHKDYKANPVFNFLKKSIENKEDIFFLLKKNSFNRWGSGWSWNDYEESYMAERSAFPLFGNTIEISFNEKFDGKKPPLYKERMLKAFPKIFDSLVNEANWFPEWRNKKFEVKRDINANKFSIVTANNTFNHQTIPFVTNDWGSAIEFLTDTLLIRENLATKGENEVYFMEYEDAEGDETKITNWHTIHSQPTDSLLKPMMHRSDNFFAEQSLLMISNEMLGFMNDEKIIDTLLKTDFKDLPQKPRWADGSGLSRYNLFTPQDFVFILNKMKNEFGMERLKVILPTGGEGTISSYYKADSGYIYGKTGTLSGVVAFSGFLYTKKGKLLIFSTLVNNHRASATDVRRAVEKFIQGIREKF